eukprot:TRINITY_DN191_c1_g2_i10.p1 TRINITY_DN191_c1_g2~~TRINITY_DN191_c1_g2_i10.p1  ORF type:complete len:262 (-),score=42.34 TRINITY_DN191_c1_g2_i10:1019-1804(-)
MEKISGKTVLVTGGAQGIGNGLCVGFAKAGANVIFGDLKEKEGTQFAEDWKNKKESHWGSITYVKFDAKLLEDCKKLVQEAIEKCGHIHVLINNVGIQNPPVPIHLLDEQTWDDVLDINLKSFFRMSKEVIPHFLSQGEGCIINIGSIQAIQSQKCVGAYAASKGGIVALTRAMAVEYGDKNIRVNCISPGTIQTELAAANTSFDYAISNTPLGNLGTVEDVAQLALSVATSRWLTGQNIVVDGGITIKGGWSDMNGKQWW